MEFSFSNKLLRHVLTPLIFTLAIIFLPDLAIAQTGIESADRELQMWRLFEPAGGNFRISLPAQPQGAVVPFETPTSTLDIHFFSSKTLSSVYTINYIDLIDESFKTPKDIEAGFDRARDEILGRTQSTASAPASTKFPLSEKKLALGNFPGRELVYDDGINTIKIQMYLVKQRGYIIAVSSPQTRNLPPALTRVFQAESDKFFGSFQILGNKKSESLVKGKKKR